MVELVCVLVLCLCGCILVLEGQGHKLGAAVKVDVDALNFAAWWVFLGGVFAIAHLANDHSVCLDTTKHLIYSIWHSNR